MRAYRLAKEEGDDDRARRYATLANHMLDQEEAKEAKWGEVNRYMGQVNAGIADTVDYINQVNAPFDWGVKNIIGGANKVFGTNIPQPLPLPYPSTAAELMDATGIARATEQPSGFLEGLARGAGQNVVALAPLAGVARGVQALTGPGTIANKIASDAFRSMTTRMGAATEVAAGALGRGASEEVRARGGGPVMQSVAGMTAPLGALAIPATTSAVQTGSRVAKKFPLAGYVLEAGEELVKGLVPKSEAAKFSFASGRVQESVGGQERAMDLAAKLPLETIAGGTTRVVPDKFGRTTAEVLDDPNLIGLQNAVGRENPDIAAQLAEGREATERAIKTEVLGTSVDTNSIRARIKADNPDASETEINKLVEKAQFESVNKNIRATRAYYDRLIHDVEKEAEDFVARTAPHMDESVPSRKLVEDIDEAYDLAEIREKELWALVPKKVRVPIDAARETARDLYSGREFSVPAMRRFPEEIRTFLLNEHPDYGDSATALNMWGLASDLRRIASDALTGPKPNRLAAKAATRVADAVDADLDAVAAVNPALKNARAATKAKYDTFDKGAVGAIRARTAGGDDKIKPEAALKKTVGKGGVEGSVADAEIAGAVNSGPQVTQYLQTKFRNELFDADGGFKPGRAANWLRTNKELLDRHPELRDDFHRALRNRNEARMLAVRSDIAAFNKGKVDEAVKAVIYSGDPKATARSLRKDLPDNPDDEAVRGLRGAFTNHMTNNLDHLVAMVNHPDQLAALREVFSKEQVDAIAQAALAVRRTEGKSIEAVLNNPTNKIIDAVIRLAALKVTGSLGKKMNMGNQLVIANRTSGWIGAYLRNITNDGARQLINDAILDPDLMRALLLNSRHLNAKPETFSKLAPYLAGAVSGQDSDVFLPDVGQDLTEQESR